MPPGVEIAIAQPQNLPTLSATAELTEAERSWLAARHTVRARVRNFQPYVITEPKVSGIAVDYLLAVAGRYGFEVEFVPDTIGFPASMKDVSGPRQHFDLLLSFTRTPEREKDFAITADYLRAPWVVYARRDGPHIIGLESLGGKSLAAETGYVISEKIKADYPKIHIHDVATPDDALLAVATGKADAYVGNLAVASYLIKASHYDNLVVTADTPYGINTQAMAVRKDWPELASLIDKGIAAMTVEERLAISEKWGSVEYQPQIDYTLIWQIVALSTLIFLAFLYWNRKLAREIALRKQVEDGLRLARDLAESANRAKTVFLATMSHELRTPMNAILGNTELLKRKLTDEKHLAQLDTVLKSANALLAMINDVLNLAKVEADHLKLERSVFKLDTVLEKLRGLVKREAQEKGLSLEIEIDPALARCPLLGDAACLGEILFKLSSNAIKFTATGGIGILAVALKETADRVEVRFAVTDSGIGIEPKDQKRLFAAFEQVDGSSTRRFGGSGLGLVICKRLVQAMGGRIGVDSELGSGSVFWFVLEFPKAKDVAGE
ncbi:MAG: transporter substrate-binding domain-containing protein [Ferribacterium limneticum]